MHRNEWKWKHDNPKPLGHYTSSAKRKVHSNNGIPQETRKKSDKYLNEDENDWIFHQWTLKKSMSTRKGRIGEPQS